MPYKHNQSRYQQHKKAKYKVINWAEYTEALRSELLKDTAIANAVN